MVCVTQNSWIKRVPGLTTSSPDAMRYRIALTLSLVLLFVWSLPGTIALRYVLLFSGLACLLPELRQFKEQDWSSVRLPLLCLGLLSGWILLQAVYISPEPSWSLGEVSGQWLPALLALALGLLLGLASTKQERGYWGAASLPLGIALVFSSQALIAVGHAVAYWFQHGGLLRQNVPLTGGKLEMSFIINLLMAFIAVDLFGRASQRGRLLPVPVPVTILLLVVPLIALYLAGARNGILGLLFLCFSATYLYLYDQRLQVGILRSSAIAVCITAAVAAFTFASIKADPRWDTFTETASLAWDIDRHDAWQGGERPFPLLENGTPADGSAYLRIAWLRVGARLMADHPVGVGYGRNAFAHALRVHYPVQLGHAHSGFVDLGVGAGLPAVMLWLAFIGSLIWAGWRTFSGKKQRLAGLLLIFMATGFTGRMVLDSVNRDHMLQIFFFLVGVMLVLACVERRQPGPVAAEAGAS